MNNRQSAQWKVLARHHKWVAGAVIVESEWTGSSKDRAIRRFTAVIRGYQGWRIWQGDLTNGNDVVSSVVRRVKEIRDRIDAGDESVFTEPGAW